MAVSFVQGKAISSGSTTSPGAITFTSNNAPGNCIVVYASLQNATTVTGISDTRGNTYNQVYLNVANGSESSVISLWYALYINAGANTINIALAASGWRLEAVAQEFHGVAGSNALDTNNHAAVASFANPQSGPAVTTTADGDLIVAAFHQGTTATLSLGSGYTNLTTLNTAQAVAMESLVQTSAGNITPTIGTTVTGFGGDAVTLALKASTAKLNYPYMNAGLRPHAFSPGLAR